MILAYILCVVGIVSPLSSLKVLDMFPEFAELGQSVNSVKQSITTIQTSVSTLTASVTQQAAKLPGTAQVIYTRWGKYSCHDSTLLYSGWVAGGFWDHYGSAANYLCLVKDPKYSDKTHKNTHVTAGIWGAEYEDPVFGEYAGLNMQNYKVPCAVCVASPATSLVMIPGKNQCPGGMRYQYWGLLATGAHNGKAAGEYICMDYHPQNIRTNHNNDGVILLPVQTRCGALSCPPYQENQLVTCVVCTK